MLWPPSGFGSFASPRRTPRNLGSARLIGSELGFFSSVNRRAAATQLGGDQRQRHRDGGRQEVDGEEEQVEEAGYEKCEPGRAALAAALARQHGAEHRRDEEVAEAHDGGAEERAL